MNAIDAAMLLGDRLCRERALSDDESYALETLIQSFSHKRAYWTRDEDAKLRMALRRDPRGYASSIAQELNRSVWSVRKRAQKLREMGRG